jgi:hypothetical protein
MVRSVMIGLLLVVANPAIAQVAAPNGQAGAQSGASGQAGTTGNTQGSAQSGPSGSGLGVICNTLIAGTFCSSGRSRAGGYGSFSAGTGANSPSLPPCASGMPANELCN